MKVKHHIVFVRNITRKVRKINGVFDCELEPTGKCRFDDENELD